MLTGLRLLVAPVSYYAGFAGRQGLFLGAFLVGGITDVVDGFLARRMKRSKKTAEFGNVLDTFIDSVFYPSGLLVYRFVPELVEYWELVLAGLLAMLFGVFVSWWRKTLNTPHPWTSKLATFSGVMIVLSSLGGFFSPVLIYIFFVLCIASMTSRVVQ